MEVSLLGGGLVKVHLADGADTGFAHCERDSILFTAQRQNCL